VYQHYFGSFTLIGAILSLFSSKLPAWMKRRYLKLNSHILDVGSGSGELLHILKRGGFNFLQGIDPYLTKDIFYESGVKVYKKEFQEVDKKFDFIMFHHSFEHMNNPLDVFKHIFTCLNDNGIALIRIPVADSFSYRKYRENWVNLDPPRHFFLHTEKSIEILASQSGLRLIETFRDANQFQFYGSELYLKNISLESYNKGDYPNFFTKNQLRKFRAEAKRLNKINQGDWASFYLQKK
jgi:SAM-dependent methyltransferase